MVTPRFGDLYVEEEENREKIYVISSGIGHWNDSTDYFYAKATPWKYVDELSEEEKERYLRQRKSFWQEMDSLPRNSPFKEIN